MKTYHQKFAITIVIALASLNIKAQTLKKKYYIHTNQVEELYSVNERNEKVGSYKSYFENGLLANEANYKSGQLDGIVKEYIEVGGKSCLKRASTYKNGEVSGLVTYYGGKNFVLKAAQGNCTSNYTRVGVWTFIEELSQEFPEGFRCITYTQTLDGDKIIEDAKTVYYHPTKKIYSEKKGNVQYTYSPQGKIIGELIYDENGALKEEKVNFLDGKLWKHNITTIEGSNKIQEKNEWFSDGKVRFKSKFINDQYVNYEGYEEDGSKDRTMMYYENLEKEKIYQKEKEEKDRKYDMEQQITNIKDQIIKAESLENQNIKEASNYYNKAKVNIEAFKNNWSKNDTSYSAYLNVATNKVSEKIAQLESIIQKNSSLKNQISSIDNKYKDFKKLFEVIIDNGYHNTDGSSILKTDYPNGKHLFYKADEHYSKAKKIYDAEQNIDKKIEFGNTILAALDKLIALNGTDTKELNKAVKKADTFEQETQLLGF